MPAAISHNALALATTSYINQNTAVYSSVIPTFDSDYDFIVYTGQESMNRLFSSRQYREDAVNADLYDVTLTVNESQLHTFLNTNTVSSLAGTNSGIITAGILDGQHQLGLRLLEVLAIKVFGHGQARAAIANDTDFYLNSLTQTFADSINTALATDINLIFNQYVQLDRIQIANDNGFLVNDAYGYVNFDFTNMDFVLPVRLTGSLDSTASVILNEGPAVGGNTLSGGAYNVPLRVLFKCSGTV